MGMKFFGRSAKQNPEKYSCNMERLFDESVDSFDNSINIDEIFNSEEQYFKFSFDANFRAKLSICVRSVIDNENIPNDKQEKMEKIANYLKMIPAFYLNGIKFGPFELNLGFKSDLGKAISDAKFAELRAYDLKRQNKLYNIYQFFEKYLNSPEDLDNFIRDLIDKTFLKFKQLIDHLYKDDVQDLARYFCKKIFTYAGSVGAMHRRDQDMIHGLLLNISLDASAYCDKVKSSKVEGQKLNHHYGHVRHPKMGKLMESFEAAKNSSDVSVNLRNV